MTLVQQEANRQVREAAEEARTALTTILADPKIKTHGLTYSEWTMLDTVRELLDEALGPAAS